MCSVLNFFPKSVFSKNYDPRMIIPAGGVGIGFMFEISSGCQWNIRKNIATQLHYTMQIGCVRSNVSLPMIRLSME